MIPRKLRHFGGGLLCLLPSLVLADTISFESPVTRVTVVELFTSHGCSSCPPAETWLGRLDQRSDLWQGVIPIAFHVDYWDYLGWRDNYASPEYSQRQRQYRRSGGLSSVYTPGMLINGEEWRGWYRGDPIPQASSEQVGQLTLSVEPGKSAEIEFFPKGNQKMHDLKAYLAILGSGIEDDIGSGENRGRSLQGDFVILGQDTAEIGVAEHRLRFNWPVLKPNSAKKYAVVAWVSRGGNPSPLQATGGWLPHIDLD
jgi:hypothetical protein